jgi:hypothetical protein
MNNKYLVRYSRRFIPWPISTVHFVPWPIFTSYQNQKGIHLAEGFHWCSELSLIPNPPPPFPPCHLSLSLWIECMVTYHIINCISVLYTHVNLTFKNRRPDKKWKKQQNTSHISHVCQRLLRAMCITRHSKDFRDTLDPSAYYLLLNSCVYIFGVCVCVCVCVCASLFMYVCVSVCKHVCVCAVWLSRTKSHQSN